MDSLKQGFSRYDLLCQFWIRKLKFAPFVLVLGLMALPVQTAHANACDIIQREGTRLLASGTPSRGKVSRLVGRYVSTSSWAKSALGPSYRSLSKPQQRQYRNKFKSYLVSRATSFARRFPGRSLKVIRKSCGSSRTIQSTYVRTNGSSATINWRIARSKGRIFISDVSVGGISLRSNLGTPLKSAFRQGGFKKLMREMR